jgi:hypothetical protein
MDHIRLTKPLPLRVEFKSAAFDLDMVFVGGSSNYRLTAKEVRGEWVLAEACSKEKLLLDLYETGIEVRRATVSETILRRMVRDGVAAVIKLT